jgi:hypothetical protein
LLHNVKMLSREEEERVIEISEWTGHGILTNRLHLEGGMQIMCLGRVDGIRYESYKLFEGLKDESCEIVTDIHIGSARRKWCETLDECKSGSNYAQRQCTFILRFGIQQVPY